MGTGSGLVPVMSLFSVYLVSLLLFFLGNSGPVVKWEKFRRFTWNQETVTFTHEAKSLDTFEHALFKFSEKLLIE